MVGSVDFYREADFVKEAVIPQQDGVVFSSPNEETGHISKDEGLLGNNRFIHGVSVRYPEYLAQFFQNLRVNLAKSLNNTYQRLETESNRYYKEESNVTSTLAALHSDPRENLAPGFAYIIVGAMSGSVIARGRNVFARIAAPLILGAASFRYALPITFKNTSHLLYELESSAFPNTVAKQDALYQGTKRAICKTVRYGSATIDSVKAISKWTRHHIKEWTGLSVE